MASPLFLERLRHNLGLAPLLDVHLAQPGVLGFQLLHARHQRHVHAAVLGAPLVERSRADAQLPAKLGYCQARLHALERLNDLAVREPRLLHIVELLSEKILLLTPPLLWGDYQRTAPGATASHYRQTQSEPEPRHTRRMQNEKAPDWGLWVPTLCNRADLPAGMLRESTR